MWSSLHESSSHGSPGSQLFPRWGSSAVRFTAFRLAPHQPLMRGQMSPAQGPDGDPRDQDSSSTTLSDPAMLFDLKRLRVACVIIDDDLSCQAFLLKLPDAPDQIHRQRNR